MDRERNLVNWSFDALVHLVIYPYLGFYYMMDMQCVCRRVHNAYADTWYAVCYSLVSVCQTPVLYQNVWLGLAVFWHGGCATTVTSVVRHHTEHPPLFTTHWSWHGASCSSSVTAETCSYVPCVLLGCNAPWFIRWFWSYINCLRTYFLISFFLPSLLFKNKPVLFPGRRS